MDVRGYLAEEIALDHADGLLSRRDALRTLMLMGFSVGAASTLLAACGGGAAPPQPTAAAPTPTPHGPGSVAPPQRITFPGTSGTLKGAWAKAMHPRGAVLVVHENTGLSPFIASFVSRLAADGFSALAPDLLSEEGGTDSLGDPANATAALAKVPEDRFVADMRSGIDELARREPSAKLGAVGFCFGGGQLWSLLAAGEPRLAAAVPFYGPCPASPDFSGSRNVAVLAVYAGLDTRVLATRDRCVTALFKAGGIYDDHIFPGVNHAFMNDTGPRYDAKTAAEAYSATLDWLGRHA
ncbi:MAG TPA: dienelactone hydrolase family protein [Candidatus Dormibacteraeota bacterium]|nr:dienelactone hydrolase family protein [Candidatus Dormibacteraeota bacterium]